MKAASKSHLLMRLSRFYDVTEVRFLKGHWEYLVRFEGCYDTVDMPGDMMEEYLKKSSLVEAK